MKLRKIILTALFIAISFCGANIKIAGTIAFDSLPAFLGALLLGPVYGGLIGFIGHIFTSLLSGFPFGIVLHCIIGFSMAVTMIGFSLVYKNLENKTSEFCTLLISGVVGTILNGPVSLMLSYPFLKEIIGKSGVFALLPVLVIASIANIIVAIVLYKYLKRYWSKFI